MKRGPKEIQLSVDKLITLHNAGWSERRLASHFEVSRTTIQRRLSGKIQRRTAVEATNLRCHKSFELTSELNELISGLLLGDAWIEKDSSSEGRLALEQRNDRCEWLESIKIELEKHGIHSSISKRKNRNTILLRTRKYRTFSDIRHKWYKPQKLVPNDLVITSKVLAHWYFGDGTIDPDGYCIVLCTDGFLKKDVELLISFIKRDCNLKSRLIIHQGKPRIAISKSESRKQFVDLVDSFSPTCFRYKLLIKERKNGNSNS